MSALDRDESIATPRAAELLADVRNRHENLRRQAEDLAQLREAARAAADRDAAAIIATARDSMRRSLDDARRALTALNAQLDAIGEPHREVSGALRSLLNDLADIALSDGSAASDDDVPDSILEVRRGLQRLLTDEPPVQNPPAAAPAAVSDAELDCQPFGDHEAPPPTRRSAWFIGAALVAGLGGGAAWWLPNVLVPPEDSAKVVALIPRAPALRVTPQPKTPMLTASLVALPTQRAKH